MTKNYREVYYTSSDGLKLYARDYPNDNAKKTVLCLHGFTRNSADFAVLCEHLRKDYRLIVPDQRGRGLSEYDKNTVNYNPAVYVQDMFTLLNEMDVTKVDIVGTSMGGVIGMTMAAMNPPLVAGLVLNDVGPEINAEGLQRVVDYLGNNPTFASWDEAVAYAKDVNAIAYPKYTDAQWQGLCRNMFVESEDGSVCAAYDSGVADPHKGFVAKEADLNAWPLFSATLSTQYLVIRGELSDILSSAVLEKMAEYENVVKTIELKEIGHAPMLDEPEAIDAIQEFLARN